MYKIKNFFKEWYEPHTSFVVRNPLFPVEFFFNWKTNLENNGETAKEYLRKSLIEFYRQPLVQEALYIGSPDLHEQLLLWLENKIEKEEKREKTELSLVKYFIRMCTRCTPYGLFGSCTVGNFAEATSLQLFGKESLLRHGRLDMDYVCELYAHLVQQMEIKDQLLFFPNSSLYRCGDQWRYIEHRFNRETGRSYHLVEIDDSSYLGKILSSSTNGKKPKELAASITDDHITIEEAVDFIYELIHNQVLVNELMPTITGEEYFAVLHRKLKTLMYTDRQVEQLEKVSRLFWQLQHDSQAEKSKLYSQIIQELQPLEVPVHLKTLIQVDSHRPAITAKLNNNFNDEILKGISLLQLLNTGNSIKDTFSDFKTSFINRYEGEFIPLSEVLDSESGIGYGKFAATGMEESPLIAKLQIENVQAESSPGLFSGTENFIWELYQQAISENKTEVFIDDKIIEQLAKKEFNTSGLPDSIYTMIRVQANSADDIDKGNYLVHLQSPSGPSGANLLGRFCHLHPDIKELTMKILREEEAHRPDCIFAEIVHLPESRTGNILMRPLLRQYEIPYLCSSGVSNEFQIPLSDLFVGVENNKVVLWSKKLNKEVIPRLTTAHNFHLTTLPVYQFLCDLQFQNIKLPSWNWGVLENRSFLPRVSYGRLIISKAKWRLTKEDCKNCDKKNEEVVLKEFDILRKQKNLPEYVLLSQGDNELLLHLDNIFCIKLLLAEVKKSGTVSLTETLDTPDLCWLESPEGKHTGEFIVSFSRKKTEASNLTSVPALLNEDIKRIFPVSSEWLYAKIYCGVGTAEKLLASVIAPFTKQLFDERIVDKFFFIRYHDPNPHIRIRFHNPDQPDFWKEVIYRLQKILQPYFENRLVQNIQFDTYRREVERYGYDTMSLSEDIFWHQSKAVLDFISTLEGDEGEHYRWRIALKAIDFFLDGFSFNLEQKSNLLTTLDKNFCAEFKIVSEQRKKIYEQFANRKSIIDQIMGDGWKVDGDLSNALNIFKVGGDYLSTINEILNARSVKISHKRLEQLLASYLHMFINRLFMGNQRKVELVLYEYLWKIYESKLAREKSEKNILKAHFANA